MLNLTSGLPYEQIHFTALTRSPTFFQGILEEAKEDALQAQQGKTVLYTSRGHEWRPLGLPRRKREIHSVVLAKGIAERIANDANDFLSNSKWYMDRGVPYRRGYLLYGPPGSGKTSFIQALAGRMDFNICVLNLSERGLTDDRLSHLLTVVPPRSIILLEDIDAAFGKRVVNPAEEKNQYEGSPVMITFSGLLNALDGVASSEERVVFMTTNHVDRLDPALIRPGRVDFRQYVGWATKDQILDMFLRFYKGHKDAIALSDSFVAKLSSSGWRDDSTNQLSTAALQGHFIMHKDQPERAVDLAGDLTCLTK